MDGSRLPGGQTKPKQQPGPPSPASGPPGADGAAGSRGCPHHGFPTPPCPRVLSHRPDPSCGTMGALPAPPGWGSTRGHRKEVVEGQRGGPGHPPVLQQSCTVVRMCPEVPRCPLGTLPCPRSWWYTASASGHPSRRVHSTPGTWDAQQGYGVHTGDTGCTAQPRTGYTARQQRGAQHCRDKGAQHSGDRVLSQTLTNSIP